MSTKKCDKKDVSLRMLLENPELLEAPSYDEPSYKGKDFMTEVSKYDTQSAFLVPNIWQDTIPPEFLDLSSEPFDHVDVSAWLNEQSKLRESNICILNNNNVQHHSNVQLPHSHCSYQCFEVDYEANIPIDQDNDTTSPAKQDVSHFEYTSSSSGSQSELSQKIPAVHGKLNLPMKAIAGDESFDPSKRSFTVDELKVAPILPKSQKNFVPSEKKDDHYWTKRMKNNTAAKRSREAKRMKENQISLRTAYLEEENARLKSELGNAIAERDELKKKLKKYEYVAE